MFNQEEYGGDSGTVSLPEPFWQGECVLLAWPNSQMQYVEFVPKNIIILFYLIHYGPFAMLSPDIHIHLAIQ